MPVPITVQVLSAAPFLYSLRAKYCAENEIPRVIAHLEKHFSLSGSVTEGQTPP